MLQKATDPDRGRLAVLGDAYALPFQIFRTADSSFGVHKDEAVPEHTGREDRKGNEGELPLPLADQRVCAGHLRDVERLVRDHAGEDLRRRLDGYVVKVDTLRPYHSAAQCLGAVVRAAGQRDTQHTHRSLTGIGDGPLLSYLMRGKLFRKLGRERLLFEQVQDLRANAFEVGAHHL